MRVLFLLLFLAAGVARADTVLTKDGQRHVGRIIDRTPTGYLFREDSGETHVLDFAQVDDVQHQAPADAPVAAAPAVQLVPQQQAPFLVELHRLRVERENQSVRGPVTGMVLGGVLVLGGATLAASSSSLQGTGAVGAVLGAALLLPSVIGLLTVVHNRGVISSEIADLNLRAAQAGIALPPD